MIRPYEVVHHRHTAEIEQELSLLINRQVRVAFTPHAVDLVRGILTTSHAWLTKPIQEPEVWRAYRTMYGNEPSSGLLRTEPASKGTRTSST